MANGFKSIHPIMAKNLKNIGIKNSEITQGWGNAKASKGFHSPEGWVEDEYGKHKYSSCVDLTGRLPFTAELKSRLVAAGFCPFFRDWPGNKHIHCVYVGLNTILDGPKSQIKDYINGRNGLVGHAKLTGPLAPTEIEKQMIKAAFEKMDGHNTVIVKYDDKEIDCYAFMGRVPGEPSEITRCELRPFVEFFGAKILDGKTILYNGKYLNYSKCKPKLEGQFNRVNLRPITNLLGKNIVKFEMKNGYGIAYIN